MLVVAEALAERLVADLVGDGRKSLDEAINFASSQGAAIRPATAIIG